MLLIHNGKTIPKEEAVAHIYDPALFANFVIYETLKVENGKILFIQDHIDRILNSARVVGMDIGHEGKMLEDWLVQCVAENKIADGALRMIIHGDPENNQNNQVYIYPEKLSYPSEIEREEGIKVVTFEGERIYPEAKTTSRLTQFRATKHAKNKGAFEAILVSNNKVHEGARSSLFLVKDNKLITSELGTILPGTRRKHVIQIAKETGILIEERKVSKDELYVADEAFVTSAIMELMPIDQIDNYQLPKEKPMFKKLYQLFQEYKGQHG